MYLVLSDLMILALLALIVALTLGVAQPDKPWLWGLLFSAAIPGAALLLRAQAMPVQWVRVESALITGMASSFLGSYAGAAMRRMVASLSK